MDLSLFAPDNLPGVGMGNLMSVVGVGGLIGLAVTSGALVASGMVGTVVFIAAAAAVLSAKDDFGGVLPIAVGLLAVVLAASIVHVVATRRARTASDGRVGTAKDDPATKAAISGARRSKRLARVAAFTGVCVAGAATGFAWAEWNEAPFAIGDTESLAGTALGLVLAAIGGDAAWRFVTGAVRAGGSWTIVGASAAIVAFVLNSVSFYVPFAGFVVLVAAALLTLRLRRRDRAKYEGLRILA